MVSPNYDRARRENRSRVGKGRPAGSIELRKSNEQVARLLRCPVGTVKGRLSRARDLL